MKIGFVGLGQMGQGIAKHLFDAGHELTVYNRTLSATEALDALGAKVAESPLATAQDAEVLITMLADDPAVESTVWGPSGLLEGLAPNAVHISMSTISLALSKRLTEAHGAQGQAYLAAPVFGRPEAAAAALLWVIAAGDSVQIERCRSLFDVIAQGVFVVGQEPWMANLVKLTGNFMLTSVLESLGESFAIMRKAGIPPEQFLEVVNTALFKSPVYKNYGTLIAEERYEPAGFKLRLGLKDVRLILEASESLASPMPLASLVRDHFLEAVANGQGDIDWAGLGGVSASHAGLKPKAK